MPECRSCGAPVKWVLTRKGKRMPVDAEPVEGGNIMLERETDSSGTPLAAYVPSDPGVLRYVSHFATCEFADRHRKRG